MAVIRQKRTHGHRNAIAAYLSELSQDCLGAFTVKAYQSASWLSRQSPFSSNRGRWD
jgi:hypothetical protein